MDTTALLNDAIYNKDHLKYSSKSKRGKIRIKASSKSGLAVKVTLIILFVLTIYAFSYFDYKDIDLGLAISSTFTNIKTVFGMPKLTYGTVMSVLKALLITFCLGALSTILGAIIALFLSLLCAKNIANPISANIVKALVAIARAVLSFLYVTPVHPL